MNSTAAPGLSPGVVVLDQHTRPGDDMQIKRDTSEPAPDPRANRYNTDIERVKRMAAKAIRPSEAGFEAKTEVMDTPNRVLRVAFSDDELLTLADALENGYPGTYAHGARLRRLTEHRESPAERSTQIQRGTTVRRLDGTVGVVDGFSTPGRVRVRTTREEHDPSLTFMAISTWEFVEDLETVDA